MKILFLGDIVGRSGREAICHYLPQLRAKYSIDITIANGENAAGGYGLTPQICSDLYKAGVDVITSGNHIWKNREVLKIIGQDTRVLRPLNFTSSSPGIGYTTIVGPHDINVMVVNLMGRVFMDLVDDPFQALEQHLLKFPLGNPQSRIIIVDFHAEATSEKMAFGYQFNGRVTAVLGTHTHVPTADHRILSKGTAYQTDVGMCGDYHSVIGFRAETVIPKFLKSGPNPRMEVAEGPGTVSGVVVECDTKSGLATAIFPIRENPF